VLGGLVTVDAKSAVLLATHAGTRQLIVVSLGNGQITQRCVAPSARVRVATRRLVAISQLEPRQLWAIDLRTGRELGNIVCDADVRDFAISPDGETLVTHADCIEVHELAALFAKKVRVEVAAVTEVAVEVKAEVAVEAKEDVDSGGSSPLSMEAIAPLVVPVLATLAPREVPAAIDRARARRQLDQELASVALWTLQAIAVGWDTRRIGYGNEGRHPFELEVAAILGLNNGHAADHLAAARERLAEHDAAIAADSRGDDTPIGALVRELGLAPVAVDILLVIAAAALWGEAARLYGILANDANRPIVDELIVQQILEHRHDRHAIAEALDPRAPLVRLGLVQVSPKRPRPFCELTVEPVVLDLLRALPPALGDATTIRSADRALVELDLPRAALEHALAALAEPHARVLVRGRAGTGRKTLLAALAACANRELAVIDARALPRQPDAFVVELRHALRRAHIAGYLPCLVDLDEVTFDDRSARELAGETLRLHPGPLAAIATPDAPSPFPAGHVAIALPALAETERRAVWLRALAEAGIHANADVLAARYRIGAAAIRRAVAAARNAADTTAAIEAFIRQTRDARLGQYARRVERLASWNSVVLPPDILDSLRELVGRVRHGRTVFDAWGMSKMMQTSRGLTALFQGPPGTGKTLVAGVIARELGLDLYQVDLSKVMSKWIGETERNLSAIFDAAEDGQVILLFDEADSLFAKRTEVRSSNDRYANLEVNHLLQRLDTFEGIAILTTNNGTSIDHAFKRRMSFRLSFPFPDEETREELWRAHLPPELPVDGTLALDALARKYQLSGGYIRNACLRAAFLAAQEETALHQRHLERAVALEYAELGKLSSGGAID
jgi:MoxR-like ATPase